MPHHIYFLTCRQADRLELEAREVRCTTDNADDGIEAVVNEQGPAAVINAAGIIQMGNKVWETLMPPGMSVCLRECIVCRRAHSIICLHGCQHLIHGPQRSALLNGLCSNSLGSIAGPPLQAAVQCTCPAAFLVARGSRLDEALHHV